MELKPFDSGDWAAFSGAEGDNPLVCYNQPVTIDQTEYVQTAVVVDDNGLEFYVYDENYSLRQAWQYHPFQNKRATAQAMATHLGWDRLTRVGLEALGFVRIA